MQKYRKKPLVVEAMQWNGELDLCVPGLEGRYYCVDSKRILFVKTLEGDMACNVGDYIVKGIEGEFYPVKESIFNKLYEKES